MNITFKELRDIKHSLPTGGVSKIAQELRIDEQSVRNFFGAKKYDQTTQRVEKHLQPGPNGGIIMIEDTQILDAARRLIIGDQIIPM